MPVSVVMTVYNAQCYVAEAIDSVLAQTYGDFEFIVVDDGSSDQTPDILRDFARQDSRLRIIARPKSGIVDAANAGIDASAGPYIARHDADDVSHPQRLEKQVEFLDGHPNVVAVGSRLQLIDPYGSPLGVSEHKLTHDEIEADLLRGSGWSLPQPAVMMRRSAFQQAGRYSNKYEWSEDLYLFLRMTQVGELANLPEPLVKYRRHLGSVNHNRHQQQDRNVVQILREIFEQRGMKAPQDLNLLRWKPLPPAQQLRQWAWSALKIGNVSVARKHAGRMLRMQPLSIESWRIMYCALRGY